MQAIIVDIDGTLADLSHRLHHIKGGRRDYEAFYAAMGADPLIKPIRDLVGILYEGAYATGEPVIILCSGRPERYRKVTQGMAGPV